MSLPQITLELPTLQLALCIVGGLLLISMVRILFLLRTNCQLRDSTEKMERQVLNQHQEILSVREDSNAWRGESQRMFDAFRAEFSKRLVESEQRYQDIQQRCEKAASLPAAIMSPPPKVKTESASEQQVQPVPALTVS